MMYWPTLYSTLSSPSFKEILFELQRVTSALCTQNSAANSHPLSLTIGRSCCHDVFPRCSPRFGNRVFDGPLKEVQIIEVASTNGGALYGTFDVSYQGHSVGVDVGASLSVLEVSISHISRDVGESDEALQALSAEDLA